MCVPQGRSAPFQLLDGSTISGDIILPADGLTSKPRVNTSAWRGRICPTLQELAKNPKHEQYAAPLVEISEEDNLKRTEPPVIKPPPRLERPAKGSLFGALFGSSIGLVALLLLYAANIYAGYEIATVRAFPPVMVCAIAAVAPVIGPIIFLCLPTRVKSAAEENVEEAPAAAEAEPGHASMADAPAGAATSTLHIAHQETEAKPALPQTQVFKRGQFTLIVGSLKPNSPAFRHCPAGCREGP